MASSNPTCLLHEPPVHRAAVSGALAPALSLPPVHRQQRHKHPLAPGVGYGFIAAGQNASVYYMHKNIRLQGDEMKQRAGMIAPLGQAGI